MENLIWIALFGQLLVTGEDFQRHYAHQEAARRLEMNYEKFFRENEDWRVYADIVAYPPLPEELMSEFHDVSPEVLARCREMVMEGGGYVSRGAIYVRVRREGEERGQNADRWATMLCLNAPPGLKTTDSFWAGRKPWHEVFDPRYCAGVKKELAKRGINIGPNQEYMPELARFRGDPEAVVPFEGARSYMKKLCERRGWAMEGAVTVEHREPESDPYDAPIADDLVRQKARQMVKLKPDTFKGLNRKEAKQKVLDKFGPSR